MNECKLIYPWYYCVLSSPLPVKEDDIFSISVNALNSFKIKQHTISNQTANDIYIYI